jgi:hypothetical protein
MNNNISNISFNNSIENIPKYKSFMSIPIIPLLNSKNIVVGSTETVIPWIILLFIVFFIIII